MICIQDNQQLSRGGGVAFSSNLFSTQTNTERLYLGGDAYSAPAIFVKEGTDSWKTYYIFRDYLGSITHIANSDGSLKQELSYDAWGRLRNPATQIAYTPGSEPTLFLGRGYTGHEHMPWFGLVNMNARLYDPLLGRFLSPDPYVQAPNFTQNFNRYSYCLNNLLSFTDPSGYSWLSDNWKSLTSAIVGIVVAAIPGGQGFGAAILAGALSGAASGFVGAVLNGANFIQTVKATLTGAFWGAASAGLNFLSADTQLAAKLFKHAFSNMWLEGVRGGNMKHGLLSGLASAAGGSAIEKYGGRMSRALKVAANAVIGGTAEELGGGKFANGAITGAFSMLFNDLMHQEPPEKEKSEVSNPIQEMIQQQILENRLRGESGLNNIYPEFEIILLGRAVGKQIFKSVFNSFNRNSYSEATFKAFEKQLNRDGYKSILKSQKNIHRKLTEHIQKRDIIKQAGGYTSSVEREIRTYQSQLNAINDLLKKYPQ